MTGAASRKAAAELLVCVLKQRKTLDEAFALTESYDRLEGSDRGFARAMASAVLRELGIYDTALADFSNRGLDTLNPSILSLARIGMAQLWRMDVSPHAAVNATVEAAKKWPDAKSGGGFLNAILRRASANPIDFGTASPLEIWPEAFREQLVADIGETAAIALANTQRREATLHLTTKSDPQALAETLGGAVIGPKSISVPASDVSSLPGFETGEWWVQDIAATLAASLVPFSSGDTVVDLCAAPGGKSLQLAASGGKVIAVDRSKKRMMRLQENCARMQLSDEIEIVTENAETWRPESPVKAILLDAPCSALGTLRRHPEGPWIKRTTDIARFPDVQTRLLRAAHDMLQSGGTVVYCVCTPLAAEGIEVVESAISEGLFVRDPITAAELPGFEYAISPNGDALTVPLGSHDHDVFFISRLVRNT